MTSASGEPSVPIPPPEGLGTQKIPWDTAAAAFSSVSGWQPEGSVHYTYESISADCGCTQCFTWL